MAGELPIRPARANPGNNAIFVHSILDDFGLSPAEFRVYGHIARRAGRDEAYPAIKSIARVCRLHPQTVRRALRVLVKHGLLIRTERPGRTPVYQLTVTEAWRPLTRTDGVPSQSDTTPSDSQGSATKRMQRRSSESDTGEGNPFEGNPDKEVHTHRQATNGLPQSLEEAIKVARLLGIESEFATQEFHAKKSVGWKDGYGNQITSWSDHLQSRWPIEQRKRAERLNRPGSRPGRQTGFVPPRKFAEGNYDQPPDTF